MDKEEKQGGKRCKEIDNNRSELGGAGCLMIRLNLDALFIYFIT